MYAHPTTSSPENVFQRGIVVDNEIISSSLSPSGVSSAVLLLRITMIRAPPGGEGEG